MEISGIFKGAVNSINFNLTPLHRTTKFLRSILAEEHRNLPTKNFNFLSNFGTALKNTKVLKNINLYYVTMLNNYIFKK